MSIFSGLSSIPTKVCSKCGIEQPATNTYFNTYLNKDNSYRTVCKTCNAAISKERSIIKKNTSPPPDTHRCPICNRSRSEISKSWEADHIHGTTYFRDWLCQDCNLGLGKFCDDPLTVIRAAMYLVDHDARSKEPNKLNHNIFDDI